MSAGDWTDYESGPFCRHYSDPDDCDRTCATCGHGCARHDYDNGETACMEDGCACRAWTEKAATAPEITPEGLQELMGALKAMYRNPHWIDITKENAHLHNVFDLSSEDSS